MEIRLADNNKKTCGRLSAPELVFIFFVIYFPRIASAAIAVSVYSRKLENLPSRIVVTAPIY
jgi:hypothetical protein